MGFQQTMDNLSCRSVHSAPESISLRDLDHSADEITV
jgi:hypothetical protein